MTAFKWAIVTTILSLAAAAVHAQVIGIATLSPGSSFYAIGTSISGVLQRKEGLTSRVQPMSGPSVYIPALNRGGVEFAISNSLDVADSFQGIENFTGHKSTNLRLVGAVFLNSLGIAVPNDSSIKSIKDLKGVRMPSRFTAQAAVRFLPMPNTRKALMAMDRHYPGAFLRVYRPSPALPGVVSPTESMVASGFLVTSTHVPEEVVYTVTKALYENKPMLEASTRYMKSFDPKMMAEANLVPYHPGAEKFYKEAGLWPPKKR